VDEIDVGQVRPDQPARVTVEAYPGRAFPGRVLKIEPQAVVEQNVTMFPVLIVLENDEGLLKPGMNAEIEVEVARRPNVVVVPNTAVTTPREAPAVAAALGLDAARVREALAGERVSRAPSPAAAAATTRRETDGGPAGGGDSAAGALAGQATRPGVVFLQGSGGPEPRRVILGLSDWDDTEVVSGLEPGQQVVILSVARLQQQQQEFQQRVQRRSGNPFSTSTGDGATAPAPAGGGAAPVPAGGGRP
jgi:HlyD family secretion protein